MSLEGDFFQTNMVLFSASYFGLDRQTRLKGSDRARASAFPSELENFPLESDFLLKRRNLPWEKHWLPSCSAKAQIKSDIVRNYSLGVVKKVCSPQIGNQQQKKFNIRVELGELMGFIRVIKLTVNVDLKVNAWSVTYMRRNDPKTASSPKPIL